MQRSGRSFSSEALRHAPLMVGQALTDAAHLSEWAPFDADRKLGAVGPVDGAAEPTAVVEPGAAGVLPAGRRAVRLVAAER